MDFDSAQYWFQFYHRHPEPARICEMLQLADSFGLLSSTTEFARHVFKDHSEMVTHWIDLFDQIHDQASFLRILWLVDIEETRSFLNTYAKDSKWTDFINRNFSEKPIETEHYIVGDDPRVLDHLWSAFFATGHKKYIIKILNVAIGESDSIIKMAAVWSLKSNAKQDTVVAEILQKEGFHL